MTNMRADGLNDLKRCYERVGMNLGGKIVIMIVDLWGTVPDRHRSGDIYLKSK